MEYLDAAITPDDIAISYLPYAHIFEQAIFVYSIFIGFSHGYYDGNPFKLQEDMKELKPTVFATVPRILNRIHQKVMGTIEQKGAFTRYLFNKGLNSKKYYLENQGAFQHRLYDSIIFKKVKAEFGGNIKCMITGSAPITGEVLTFFKVALGIHVYEAYGQTESVGPITVTHPADPTAGHVGGCVPSMKVRLRDCPELGYFSSMDPPKGELQFIGTNMFKGYFRNPEKTREAFDEDGWVRFEHACNNVIGEYW
jgi:long-chain acyl-CoA synthetase